MAELEELALRRGVCAEPADDNVRLVYADWLSDHGREPQAEFIRLQVELAKSHPHGEEYKTIGRIYMPGYAPADPGDDPPYYAGGACAKCRRLEEGKRCPYHALWSRERYLLRNHWDEWLPWKPSGEYLFALDGATVELGSNHSRWTFRRGFLAELSCSAEFFLEHADAMLWNPAHTVPILRTCPECMNGFLQGDDNLNEYGGVKCLDCDGAGRVPDLNWLVPAPFPATAQPVEKVTLTTFPTAEVGEFNDLRPWKKPLTWGGDTRTSFAAEWPWLTFGWPRGAEGSPVPHTTGYEPNG